MKRKCGILGATGTVGQRFISLIGDSHPLFTIHALGASPRSVGKLYPDAVNWKLADDIPESVKKLVVRPCAPSYEFSECDLVFSGLDADVATDIGTPFV
jgi:aspartate-semialdehyde dehydrogenase